MAQFKNMYKVELNNGIAPVVSLKQIYYADVEANRIGAIVTMNGQPFPLSGTCTGSAILADGSTVPMTGVIDGNQAYIDLDSSCYSVEGQIKIFVKITTGGVTTTLLAAVGTVQLTETDTVIDPGTIIPSVSALITAIEDAVESIPADYTALLETIAPMYANLTFPVKAGQWCWYSGVLYEAKQDISTSENWTAAHWGTTTVGGSVSELKSAISVFDTPAWAKGTMNAIAQQTATSNAVINTCPVRHVVAVNLTGCSAHVFLYSGTTYLGKVVSASGAINKTSGSWYGFTGSVPVGELMKKNNADGVRLELTPTDSTAISGDDLGTWIASHCTFATSDNGKVTDMENAVSMITDKMPLTFTKGTLIASGGSYSSGNGSLSVIFPLKNVYKIIPSANCKYNVGLYTDTDFIGKFSKAMGINKNESDFYTFCGELNMSYVREIAPTATRIRIGLIPWDGTITTETAQTYGDNNLQVITLQSASGLVDASVGVVANALKDDNIGFIHASLSSTGSVLFNQNAAITSDIISNPVKITVADGASARVLVYSNGTYVGKIAGASYVANQTEGTWYDFHGEVPVADILNANNGADGVNIMLIPRDGTTLTDATVKAWADSKLSVYSNPATQDKGYRTYIINHNFEKKKVELSSVGTLPISQAFCKYNGKYYVASASSIKVVNAETFEVETTYSLSLGHGNSISLGASGYAYISGCTGENKNELYKVDLSTGQKTETIILPFGETIYGSDVCVDEIAGRYYIFVWYQQNEYTPVRIDFVVYDYINEEIISKKTLPRLIQAPQACDCFDDRIILAYGYENGKKQMPNGWLILDTSGNLVCEYVLTPLTILEPEGVFIDRETRDILLSSVDGHLYKINNQ